ncbi:MAG: outer membrane beta-barrel protein, partial [Crocinitomicaceae bacterium]
DWSGELKPFQNRWNSIGLNVNFMKDIKFKKTKVFSLGFGLGYGLSSISSQQKFIIENNLIKILSIQNSVIYDHTRIKTHRFFIPLELRFSTKNWNRWKFAIGGSFGINALMNHQFIGLDGSKMESTDLGPAASLLNYGLHTRLGYRNFSLFGSYQINNLFRGRGNPDLHQFQLGLSISLF